MSIAAMVAASFFSGCQIEAGETEETPVKHKEKNMDQRLPLPADVGEDTLAGKTFYYDGTSQLVVFGNDKTYTLCGTNSNESSELHFVCSYSYNADQNLLYSYVEKIIISGLLVSYDDIVQVSKLSKEKAVLYLVNNCSCDSAAAERFIDEVYDDFQAESVKDLFYCYYFYRRVCEKVSFEDAVRQLPGYDSDMKVMVVKEYFNPEASLEEIFNNYYLPDLYANNLTDSTVLRFEKGIMGFGPDNDLFLGMVTGITDNTIKLRKAETSGYTFTFTDEIVMVNYTFNPAAHEMTITYNNKTYEFNQVDWD